MRRAHAVVHHRAHGAPNAVHVRRVGVLLELELGAGFEKRRGELVGRLKARVHAFRAGDARDVVVHELRRDLEQVVHLLLQRLARPQVVALRRLRGFLRRRRGRNRAVDDIRAPVEVAARLSLLAQRRGLDAHLAEPVVVVDLAQVLDTGVGEHGDDGRAVLHLAG